MFRAVLPGEAGEVHQLDPFPRIAGHRARLRESSGAGLGDLGDRVMGRGGAILCGPGANGDEDSFEKVTAFPAPEP